MKKELQDKLFKKYPKIFRQKDLPSTETCMCWGITCGDGWYDIIDALCASIKNHIEWVNEHKRLHSLAQPKRLIPTKTNKTICEAAQVKEKFGGLRFYIDGGNKYIEGLIAMSEAISYKTCEYCGFPGKPLTNKWIRTTCENCKTTINKINQNKK